MASQAVVKIKIMPESPDTDLDKIEKQVETILLKTTKQIRKEKEPIAFGLVALIITYTWPEEISTDPAIDEMREISEINSVEIIDFRRAIG